MGRRCPGFSDAPLIPAMPAALRVPPGWASTGSPAPRAPPGLSSLWPPRPLRSPDSRLLWPGCRPGPYSGPGSLIPASPGALPQAARPEVGAGLPRPRRLARGGWLLGPGPRVRAVLRLRERGGSRPCRWACCPGARLLRVAGARSRQLAAEVLPAPLPGWGVGSGPDALVP